MLVNLIRVLAACPEFLYEGFLKHPHLQGGPQNSGCMREYLIRLQHVGLESSYVWRTKPYIPKQESPTFSEAPHTDVAAISTAIHSRCMLEKRESCDMTRLADAS